MELWQVEITPENMFQSPRNCLCAVCVPALHATSMAAPRTKNFGGITCSAKWLSLMGPDEEELMVPGVCFHHCLLLSFCTPVHLPVP